MKIAILCLALLIIGSKAVDLEKVHDWVQKDINNFEKYIQETDISSEILLGLQKTESGKNYQNWILSTNHKQHLELTDGQVKKSNAFGPDSEYFTEITSNLIFLGTQIKDKEWVKIAMKKSENNQQRMDMFSLDNYEGVSLINTEGEPIMNRLLIVEKRNEIISTYDEQGKSVIYLSNLQENQNLFYVLYSQNSELSDIEKLFNYIVKNIVSLEKQALQEEKPQSFDQGEEETEPNGLEEIPKDDEPKEEEQKEEEEQATEEQKEEQQPEEEEAEEHHQEVPEEDCPGGEEDDTVKNKVDVDNTHQLESQNDEKHVKLQTDQAVKKPEPDTETEETEEVTEEVVEEVVEKKSAKKVGETKASLPPQKEEKPDTKPADEDEPADEPEDQPTEESADEPEDEPADEPASEPESEPEPPSEEYQNCAGEELDTVKNKKDLDAELQGKQEKVFQAKEVTIKSKNEDGDGQGDSGSGDNGSGDQGSDDQGTGDSGSDDQGSGDQGSGDQGSDDQGSGDQGSDDSGSGDQGSDDSGSGDQGSDDQGSGDQGSGDSGSSEQGSDDQGSSEQGSGDSGSSEEGSGDSGSGDSGSDDSGSDDQGSTGDDSKEEKSESDSKDQQTDQTTEETGSSDTEQTQASQDEQTEPVEGQTESSNNEQNNETESGNNEQGDQTESTNQEDQTESSNNEEKDQTESGTNAQEDQTESGNNEQGDQTESSNNEQGDQTQSDSQEQEDQTESSNNEQEDQKNHQADDKPANHGSESKDDSEPEPCVILYSQCHFQGDELRLCGAHPVIPNDMKNFKVKSIKVPEGVQVTFFNKPNFDDERLHTKQEMECLETPLRLNLLELMNNLRLTKGVNVNSIAVTL